LPAVQRLQEAEGQPVPHEIETSQSSESSREKRQAFTRKRPPDQLALQALGRDRDAVIFSAGRTSKKGR